MSKDNPPQSQDLDLIKFLAEEYMAALHNVGKTEEQMQSSLERAKAFIDFSRAYLAENRPRGLTHPDDNYGIILSNGKRANISPPASQLHGTMVSATGQPVNPTPGAPLADVVANQGAVPITGVNFDPNYAVDYSKADGKGVVDKAAAEPSRDYKKPGFVDDMLNR